MSRARPIGQDEDGEPLLWIDRRLDGNVATPGQMELLAAACNLDLDDLFDERPTQREVVERLREAFGEDRVPAWVKEHRAQLRALRALEPPCRLCGRVGDSTRHHFVNKWIMLELSNYKQVADRRLCTVPVCVDCHRWIHLRNDGERSIARQFGKAWWVILTDEERRFTSLLIERLRRERPDIFALLEEGDRSVYEACLVQDWLAGEFD